MSEESIKMIKRIQDLTFEEFDAMTKIEWGDYSFQQGLKASKDINQTIATTYLLVGILLGAIAYHFILN